MANKGNNLPDKMKFPYYDSRVIYQLTLCGCDGVVIASDCCERIKAEFGDDFIINQISKN